MKVNIVTLGCSKNTVDSENIAGHLTAAGHTVFFDRQTNDCDLVIVNTCGFIGDAKEESINTLLRQIQDKQNYNRRHAHDGKRRTLYAVGCLVQRYRQELQEEMPEVDSWYGAHQWETIVQDAKASNTTTHEPFTAQRTLSTPHHYAYLKIAEGCNRACSYCAIPLIRGKHVSRPIEELIDEAKTLVQNGVKELILIAQDTTYYGLDLYGKRRLGDLLERLATESGAEWIRLHYTYPTSFPVDAIEAMQRHPNICNYIDIPLQHINSRILGSMQRGIDRQGTLELLQTT
jgi:ribosomal protein S12 methylthiotransferase